MANKTQKIFIFTVGLLVVIAFTGAPLFSIVATILSPAANTGVSDSAGEDATLLQRQATGYETVLKREPDNMNAISGLADIRARQGKLEEAITLLRKAQQTSGDPRVTLSIAELYQKNGKVKEALQEYDILLTFIPDFLPALLGKATTLKAAGRLPEAQKVYAQALAKAPENLKKDVAEAYSKVKAGTPPAPVPAAKPPTAPDPKPALTPAPPKP